MKVRLVGACIALVFAMSGCWRQAGYGAGRTGHNPHEDGITAANVDQLAPVWTAPLSGAPTEALIDGGATFVHATGGAVYSFDLASGTPRWVSTRALPGDSVPAIADGQLYAFGDGPETDQCQLVSLDVATGAENFAYSFGARPPQDLGRRLDSVCLVGDAVVAGGKLAISSRYYWVSDYRCSPLFPVFISSWGERLDVFAIGEPPNWVVDRNRRGCGPEASSEQSASIVGEDIILGTVRMEAYPLADCGSSAGACVPAWTASNSFVGSPVALGNGDVVSRLGNSLVSVLDGTTHTEAWRSTTMASVPVATNGSTIFAAGTDGVVSAYAAGGCGAATCGPLWTATLPSPASVRPSIGGDVVYVGSEDGTVTAPRADGCGAATCEPLWSSTTGGRITGAPVISDGTLVVGSADGTVTAFRP